MQPTPGGGTPDLVTEDAVADEVHPRSGEHEHGDRWHWRHKIRQDPRKLFFYRFGVGILGTLLVLLGLATGPLPGPGGIPLVLLGLAIWSSEFHWARRLMAWFKLKLHQVRQWSKPRQVLFWVVFILCCWIVAYAYGLIAGIPEWMPDFAEKWLSRLPGL